MSSPLRDLIALHKPLVAPSIYDGISAAVLRDTGFSAAYVGSYATGATKYAVPDIGYIGVEDMADQIRRLAPIANVPLIVDGEGGWGNPLHVARSIKILERAGAAAIHIEDHEFGKHIVMNPRIIPVGKAVDKIKAAVDARESEDLMIIARTDSPGTEGAEAALDRLFAYEQAGADGLFYAGIPDAAVQGRLKAESNVPIFGVDFPGQSAEELGNLIDVVLYYGISHLVTRAALQRAFTVLATEGSTVSLEEELGGIPGIIGFDDFLGVPAARVKAGQYGLLDEEGSAK
ncbi:isocitrate lyase/PEP mutase family protein [Subtercola endophyticus]|uniref:isocitrate lyase/PEP mutase family protein n=1 Tax=Subtercola endophyticus TaxID=2895559 RepID=UPI001E3FE2FB|nr:isocitrate lyase/PEP mutase family protein [Subtercola endophyticus]UFS58741.1 isocitrate lyase/PEP mutase family protein [Subtercola endophyticus]